MKKITTLQLIEAITQSSTKKEAAEKLKLNISTFRTKLKLANIDFNLYCIKDEDRSKKTMPEINRQWLIDNWVNSTKSIKQLANELNIKDSLLESRINRYGLTKKFKHKLNTEKLFNLNDPHVWYIAGLATTDGYFPENQDACTFELVGEDEYNLLQEIKLYFESSQEVTNYIRKDKFHTEPFSTVYWRIQAQGLQDFFAVNFGINTRHKTFETNIPKKFPSEDCAKAYVRGCFDGDGYLSKDAKTFKLCTASPYLVSGVQAIIKMYTNIDGILGTDKRSHNREFPAVTYRTNKAKAVLIWLYSLDDCFRLERKFLRFKNNMKE